MNAEIFHPSALLSPEFKRRVRHARGRDDRRVAQFRLCALVEICPTRFSQYMNGRRVSAAAIEPLTKLGEMLGLTPDQIFEEVRS